MNILVKAIQDAMYTIPYDVLRKAFMLDNGYRARADSLESQILAKVIKKRVVVDAQIAMGEHMQVRLNTLTPVYVEDYRCVYEIPSSLLQNKTILTVLGVSYTPYAGGIGSFGYAYGGVGPLFSQDTMTAAQQAVEASSAVPNVATAKVELIGENTVMIEDAQRFNTSYWLSCYVTDEKFMNSIDPRSYEYFSTLCEHAIKSYIYNKLVINMGRAEIEGGSALGVFKEVVDGYADSESNYRTFLRETWAAVALMNNRPRYYRMLKMQVPIGL